MSEEKLSQGTFKCDICGRDTPHHHDGEEVEIERFVRPAFEKTTVPHNSFHRMCGVYSDRRTESLWQHFVSGWFASKKLLHGYWNYGAKPCAKCGAVHDGACQPAAPTDPYAKLEALRDRLREQAHEMESPYFTHEPEQPDWDYVAKAFKEIADEISAIAELRAGEGK